MAQKSSKASVSRSRRCVACRAIILNPKTSQRYHDTCRPRYETKKAPKEKSWNVMKRIMEA